MSRPGKHVYKRKDGRWEGRYIKCYVDGRPKYGAVYGHSCQEVQEKLERAKALVMEATKVVLAGTVGSIAEQWLKEASSTLKPASVNKYEDIIRCYIRPVLGEVELSEITNSQLIDFTSNLMTCGGAKGQPLASSTVIQVVSTMSCLRSYALKRDCTVLFDTDCITLRREKEDIRVFTEEEENLLVDWLCENYDLTSLSILLCLFSGLRVGEICALTWDDFDFAAGTFRVDKTMQRIRISGNDSKKTEIQINPPKSECSIRTLPIPANLRDKLFSERREGAYLLTGSGTQYVEPRTLQYRFKRILEKTGITDANFHATRHTYATRCIEQGMDAKCLSELLGHASVIITLNRYVHPSMTVKKDSLKKLTDCFPLLALATA